MKKLVSLALVLTLVLCVGVAFAATQDLPKKGDPTAQWAPELEADLMSSPYYPIGATSETKLGTLEAGKVYREPGACEVYGVCRHFINLDDPTIVIQDESVKKENGTYVYEHLFKVDHNWVPTGKKIYENIDDEDVHLTYRVEECSHCLKTQTVLDTPKYQPHEFEWYPVTEGLIPCLDVIDLEYRCKLCGYANGETTQSKPKGHVWDGQEKLNVIPGNCSNREEWDYHCTVCGELQHNNTDGEFNPDVHNYGDIIEVTPATCTKDGDGYQLCWWCRKSVLDDITIPAHGHTWDEGRILPEDAAYCDRKGRMVYYCTNADCDAAIGDTLGAVIDKTLGTVQNFGYPTVPDVLNTVDSILSENMYGYKTYTTLPDYKTGKRRAVSVGKAWYFVEVPVIPHTYDNDHIVIVKPETCTENGEAWYTCIVCKHEEMRVIPAHGHDWQPVWSTATCEEDGFVQWECQCKVCPDEDTNFEELGDEKVNGVPKTATEWGDGTPAWYRVPQKALGHQWSEWVRQNDYVEGSTLGYWLRECTRTIKSHPDFFTDGKWRCFKQDFLIAEDPSNDRVEDVIKPATCTEDGQKRVREYDPRDTKHENPVSDTIQVIPATGHTWVETEAVAPTHTKPGKTAGKKCSVCGAEEGIEDSDEPLKDGLCNGKDGCETGAKDGEFVYFEKGEVSETKSGLVDFEGGKFYLKDGKIDTSLNGVDGGEKLDLGLDFYWFNNGQVANNYSGLAAYIGTKGEGWFVVTNGKVDLSYMGLYTWAGQRFVISYGQWAKSYNGFYWTDDAVVFVEDGMVSTSSGLVNYNGGIFLIEKGILCEDFTGEYADHNGTIFNVDHGMVR